MGVDEVFYSTFDDWRDLDENLFRQIITSIIILMDCNPIHIKQGLRVRSDKLKVIMEE